MDVLPRKFQAPEIYSEYWFNSDPIPMSALRGYVILIHFWDYTSDNSLRTLPYLAEWHRRYADRGLVVIGVHAPEFPFGRDPLIVRQAVEKLSIRYPVVMDNEFRVWGAFRNTAWPAKYLIDRDGYIRFVHTGEGSYQNFEHSIQSLLAEAGYRGEFPLVMDPFRESDRAGAVCYKATPQIFCGYQRGTVGNVEGFAAESTSHFEDPGYYLEGRVYLHGNWYNTRNFLKLDEEEGREGYLVVKYHGKEVNLVAKPEGEERFQVFVTQEGSFLTLVNKGDDIKIDEEGRSYFLVQEPKLFNIVKNKDYGEYNLKLSSRSNGLALYSISFVSCVIPELISNN